jgi:4-amino-4-deoxy-L-arabinose transferase-like glycosyltransferase
MSETKQTDPSERDGDDASTRLRVAAGSDAGEPEGGGAAAARGETDPDEPRDVLARGNPLRVKRGLLVTLAGALPAFVLMAKNSQTSWGIAVGAVFVAVAAWGVMDLLGTFDDGEEHVAARTDLAQLRMPLLRTAGLLVAFGVSLWAAQRAIGPAWASGLTVTGSFLGFVASLFDLGRILGPFAQDELGLERPLLRRHGFWVIAVGALLYFPLLGRFSLWDPWETHYGEVAREILSRDDWISLWWAQDGWFWSKPILNFWIQSISMGALGTGFRPDQMLAGAGGLGTGHPEWALRTPNVLMTIAAMYLLYKGVAKVFGRRAGLLGAIVLATAPDWFFLSHQTMTDMPFVAAMTSAMGLLLYGLNTPEDARVRVYEVRAFGASFRLSLWHAVFGAVLVCAIPQILYLLSRNLELVFSGDGPKGLNPHLDSFMSGSPGNCGLPGNDGANGCTVHLPASIPRSVGKNGAPLLRYFASFEPSLQALAWSAVIGIALWLNWGERRARRLVYVAAWLFAAIATMAKGPAGFGLPIICAFAYVATKKRWSELLRFEMLTGLLVILAVALPWYVAMYVRHGSPFTDRLIFHDMFNRAFSHVHDTNEGDDTGIRFYIWQLGYALFPWTGLAPLGLLWGFRRSDSALARTIPSVGVRVTESPYRATRPVAEVRATAVGDASVMLVMWFVFAFALFTFMGTKFHHYIFPAVPPAAMLVGIVLDDMLGKAPLARPGRLPLYLGGLALGAALAVFGVMRLWPGAVSGERGDAASLPVAALVALVGVAVVIAVVYAFRSPAEASEATADDARTRHEARMFAGSAVLAGLVVVLVGRDLVIKPDGADQPGAIRLLQLFTYNYRRPWPDTLDFAAVLAGFTAVAALICVALAFRAARRHMVVLFSALAVLWAVWGLDVYMMKLSPHWGQHELVEAYYRDRKSDGEWLVAYQMNWKGENIYTGNHVPAFVSSGAPFQTWLGEQRKKGATVMYFITEHSRTGGLRSEVGGKSYKEITDKVLCNKFVVVRAEL